MVIKNDILMFYKTIRKYKDHDKTLELCVNHYFPKVSDRMTVKEFSNKVENVVNQYLTSRERK